jgi:ribosomal protein S20
MTDVTKILSQIQSGDPSAAEQLLPQVHGELRKLVAAKLTHEQPGQKLQARRHCKWATLDSNQ